jgi:hypothetical protein
MMPSITSLAVLGVMEMVVVAASASATDSASMVMEPGRPS